jgi:predicted amidohydrolase YtcJ
MEEAALAASRVALRTGITSVHTLLDTPDQMIAYSRLRRKGKLPIRVVGMPPYSSVEQLHRHGSARRSAMIGCASEPASCSPMVRWGADGAAGRALRG